MSKPFSLTGKSGQLLTGQPGTQNDETFQQQAEHFSLQVIPQNVFGNHSVHHLVQQFGVGYREPQSTIPEVPLNSTPLHDTSFSCL